MALENLARNIRTSAAALALATTAACTGGGGGGGGCTPTEPGCGGGDTQKPSISWTAPNNNATIQGTVPLSVNANDNIGVTNVVFYNGSQQISSDNSAPYTANLNTNNLQNGNYTLRAVARDAAGNTNEANIAISVNNPFARPSASDINLTVQEDSTKNHDLSANVTGEQNGAIFTLLNTPNDVNAAINGSTLNYGGAENINGNRDLQYVVTNTDGQADTANINLTITPMTDYRFELREFFSKTPITDSWSTKINGETKNATNGIVEGQITPGVYNIELTNHTNTFPADRIEIGEDVRILFPKFNTDTLTFNNDFTATTYRPSKNDANFNEQTLPSWLAIYDDEAFGVRVPLEQKLNAYNLTLNSASVLSCIDSDPVITQSWRGFQNELVQRFSQYYDIELAEGHNPPTRLAGNNNEFVIPAENTLILCKGVSLTGAIYEGPHREFLSASAHDPFGTTPAAARVEGYIWLAGARGEDKISTPVSFFSDHLESPFTDLTPFDWRAVEIGQAYARPAGVRRVESNGATPFFSLRNP